MKASFFGAETDAVSVNPANGVEIARYPFESESKVEQILKSVEQGFAAWSGTSLTDRAAVLRKMAAALRRNVDSLAEMATSEMGKPIVQARAEVEKCAVVCEWYASNGPAMLEDEKTVVDDGYAYVSYLPMGAVLAVMPWNFPYWQILRGAVPIILGGNPYVLKHAPNVMGCAYLMQRVWKEAGLPEGVFAVLNVTPDLVSKVIQDPRITAVAVTGSVRAGSAIAAQAGAALKKSVLELGGSDPFIVLADADLDAAVSAAIVGRFQNTGQICIAAKRIIVEKSVAEEFTRRFVEAVRNLKVGDPTDESTFVGPMARFDLRDELDEQVQKTIDQGAMLLTGGKKIDGQGNYYAPTVLSAVRPGMTSFDQEVFGPVASLIVAEDAEEAVRLANLSEFGLSGALWTRDKEKAKLFARQLQTGGLFVNGYSASDPRVPIGGVKKSGYGRELSHFGLREFTNIQTVWIDRTGK
ncbi:NAD-dependent succinate-semialdehyde dehydrogenase [Burkholderia cepacia]|uniref:NAD-dependent succinate-semialdehyde dehydrogenase n=1 Tax=Burkholderia cepacia TaxID=292 RepID=UPI00298FBA85|nr:NAD-dependent succinate-semialdehyde dehydrogenase [Burkholderia cepacia]